MSFHFFFLLEYNKMQVNLLLFLLKLLCGRKKKEEGSVKKHDRLNSMIDQDPVFG